MKPLKNGEFKRDHMRLNALLWKQGLQDMELKEEAELLSLRLEIDE